MLELVMPSSPSLLHGCWKKSSALVVDGRKGGLGRARCLRNMVHRASKSKSVHDPFNREIIISYV